VDAFAADLNAGLFHSARIPANGLHISLEIRGMSVFFNDKDQTFLATTENGFRPEQTVAAPTVVGSKRAVILRGDSNTEFAFPGGFDIGSFALAVPQLRIGSLYGTEAVLRYLFYDTGNADLGDLDLYGVGVRHSISQYLGPAFPVDLAMSFFWQDVSLGKNVAGGDLIDAKAMSVGIHASRRFWNLQPFDLQPFAGLTYDTFALDVSYETNSSGDTIDLEFDTESHLHLTLGLSLGFRFVDVYGEYNVSVQNAFSIGLGFRLLDR
jgi:hypothetical protein